MTRKGRLPDHVYEQLETNSRHTHGECSECFESVKIKREHPHEDRYICESCYLDIEHGDTLEEWEDEF